MLVRWTKRAAQDLTRICDYSTDRFGPSRARKTALDILGAAESLMNHPNKGRPGRKKNTRELVIPGLPFLIVYRIRSQAVEVLRILHGAQKWPG